jgi:hypothetical protein
VAWLFQKSSTQPEQVWTLQNIEYVASTKNGTLAVQALYSIAISTELSHSMCSRDPESYASGSVATGSATQAGQVKG